MLEIIQECHSFLYDYRQKSKWNGAVLHLKWFIMLHVCMKRMASCISLRCILFDRRSRSPGKKPPEELAQHFKWVIFVVFVIFVHQMKYHNNLRIYSKTRQSRRHRGCAVFLLWEVTATDNLIMCTPSAWCHCINNAYSVFAALSNSLYKGGP